MKRLVLISIVLSLLLPATARAEVFFAFSAEQMNFQGQQRIFFVPFSFVGPTERAIEKKMGVLFEKLHGSRQNIYGETYLIVKDNDGVLSAHLILDEANARFHDIIIGEVYLTFSNIGLDKLYVGEDAKQITDEALKFPYFAPTVPLWEALPPVHFSHALIRMGVNEYLESKTFHERMDKRDPELLARVLAMLKSEEPYVRLKTLEAFPQLQLADENAQLIPMLTDPDVTVRYKVIELTENKTDPAVLDGLAAMADSTDDPESQLRAARILVKNGRNNYQLYILFEELKSEDTNVVVATLQKLASSGDKRVLPALVRYLTHDKEEVRKAAFAGLNQMGDVGSLRTLLLDVSISENFRKQIAIALMRQQLAEPAKEGIKYLVTKHAGKEAVEAITTIEMRKYLDLTDMLIAGLHHTDAKVAGTAITAVGNLGLIDQLPELSKAAAREDLTAAARETMSALLATQKLRYVMKLAASKDILIRELAVLSLVAAAKKKQAADRDIEPILALLGETVKDEEPVIKRASVQALFEIGGKRNWKRVLKVKNDKDPKIRIIAISAAVSMESEIGDAAIVEKLADETDEVRVEAVVATRGRKIKAARAKLKFMVGSRNKKEKLEVLRTIVALNETEDEHREFVETYKQLLFDMDPEMQLAAIQGIQWIIDPAIPPLMQSGILLMHKDARVRAATTIALGRSRDHNVIEFIARGFADPDRDVQAAGVEGLRLMGHKKGKTPLEEFVRQTDDDELKAAAEAALDHIENQPKGLLEP